jgi:hypothetical protein
MREMAVSGRLPRLGARDLENDQQRVLTRKVDRRPASGSVVIQSSAGDQVAARLRDLSVYGCNLACTADWLRLGRFITIRVGSDRQIQALVRWSRDGTTGVEFLRAIAQEDVDTIGRLS